MLNLEAKTSNERLLLKYLEENASDVLCEKINSGKKTLKQCWEYIRGEARKKAVNGCACIDDATVFGWAMHFFEEDGIKAAKVRGPVREEASDEVDEVIKEAPKPKAKKTVLRKDETQLSFDFF